METAPRIFDLPAFAAFVRVENLSDGGAVLLQQGLDYLDDYTKDTSDTQFREFLHEIQASSKARTPYIAEDLMHRHEVSPAECSHVSTMLMRIVIRYRPDVLAPQP